MSGQLVIGSPGGLDHLSTPAGCFADNQFAYGQAANLLFYPALYGRRKFLQVVWFYVQVLLVVL